MKKSDLATDEAAFPNDQVNQGKDSVPSDGNNGFQDQAIDPRRSLTLNLWQRPLFK